MVRRPPKWSHARTKPEMQNFSNRLGGQDLTTFRDTVRAKRDLEDDKETLEAGFAKAKRIRAMRMSTALKTKLASVEGAACSMGGRLLSSFVKKNERKSEERRAEEKKRRRAEEKKRRREEIATREARYLADKAEAAESRHQEKLEREERAHRDRNESRARRSWSC
ncbi:hypothetical protein PF010_g5721 [Phytophthora fragariae]|uniref:Uncharacterized protein n=1 Tax=Phytophthora fragariae TaxID=53985 RepID=A0A6G0PGU5_9STRA|nr:hypothetical protein PF010_g5721 [Phytophthora fragariae]KAE9246026.1 hypothetical protein PF004_g4987 [Phytophthora fragariae]